MNALRWKRLLVIAVTLLMVGVALPMAMVVGWLPSTYLLNFLAWSASVSGLFLGSYGIVLMVRSSKPPE